jgi:hypothetical protein
MFSAPRRSFGSGWTVTDPHGRNVVFPHGNGRWRASA